MTSHPDYTPPQSLAKRMAAPAKLDCGRFQLSLERPLLMGIVNVTSDSFSGDGLAGDPRRAVAHGLRLVAEGADLLDVGAESSRPGAVPVTEVEELRRLIPVIEGLSGCGVPLSVDTLKPGVMHAVLAAGADMINDIAALTAPGALEAVAKASAAVCLMHMQGSPRTMQQQPGYGDVVAEVRAFLAARVREAERAGIDSGRIVLDPGFGFGKRIEHNIALFRSLDRILDLGYPLLVGVSRKSMLGDITGRPVAGRIHASVAAALLAAQRGAHILRVHDVAATRDALAVWRALGGVEDHPGIIDKP
ncbi:MAG TPA: dihydropteroate synthase [Rhodocyclaceae bacterium]|nr:dihydropteroate synthase [Rhodocyclaceae bacterium]